MANSIIKANIGAVLNSYEGDIVTIKSPIERPFIMNMQADITPLQDLHGYDKPWAGGNGKNKFGVTLSTLKSINTLGSWSGDVYTNQGVAYTFQVDSNGYVNAVIANGTSTGNADLWLILASGEPSYNGMILSGCPANGSTSTYMVGYSLRNSPYTLFAMDTGSGATIDTQSVTGTHFLYCRIRNGYTANNVIFKPMVRLASETDASFAPYSNICPISGWTEEKITRTGKNLFNPNDVVEGKYITSDGGIGTLADARYTGLIPVVSGASYVFQYKSTSAGSLYRRVAGYDAYGNFIQHLASELVNTTGQKTMSFTVPNGVKYVRVSQRKDDIDNQIEKGSTATDYEPFGQTFTIDLGGTRYGAKLNVTTGKMVVTHRHITENDFASASSGPSAGGLHYIDIPMTDPVAISNKGISNMLARNSNGWSSATPCFTTNTGALPHIFPVRVYADATSLADFKTKFSGLQIVYELATPLTVQLTPTQIEALLGTNNVWCSTGQTKLTALEMESIS